MEDFNPMEGFNPLESFPSKENTGTAQEYAPAAEEPQENTVTEHTEPADESYHADAFAETPYTEPPYSGEPNTEYNATEAAAQATEPAAETSPQPEPTAEYAQQAPQYGQAPFNYAQPFPPYAQPYAQQYPQPPYQQYPQPPYYPYPQPAQPVPPQGNLQYDQSYDSQYAQPYPQPQQAPYNPQTNPYQPLDYRYTQPAQPYNYPANPYAAPAPQPKPRTSTGTKVFLIILTAITLAMLIGFIIFVGRLAESEKNDQGFKDSDSGIVVPDIYDDLFNDRGDSSFDSDSAETFDEEITLVEDNGDTQKRDDDNPDSVGEPDPKAKGVELKALPKDKEDSKYTAQSTYDAICNSVVTVLLYEDKISDSSADIKGQGTGTIMSSDGYIVTNAHVVANSKRYAVKVVLSSGESYQAKIVGYDTWTDLAVLKIDAKDLTPVVFGDSELIEIGQDVVAIGSPGGEKFQNSLTKGIVSAVDRELSINKYVRYIQSDAAISPGNSGGPLCNIYGQVIGINTAKTTATNYEAMTFSIPSATVKEIVSDLIHYGYVRGRARIGFVGSEISSADQSAYGIPSGVLISEIDSTGSLAGTGIKSGDIITAVDGTDISCFQDIYAILNEHKAGDKISVSVYRR